MVVASPLLKIRVGRILVRITQDDIDRGSRYKADCCPVALTLKRMGFSAINVWGDRTSFLDPQADEFIHRSLPQEATEFVRAFDNKKSVKPIRFHL